MPVTYALRSEANDAVLDASPEARPAPAYALGTGLLGRTVARRPLGRTSKLGRGGRTQALLRVGPHKDAFIDITPAPAPAPAVRAR